MTDPRPVVPADLGSQVLFTAARDAVVLVNLGDGRVVQWNPAAERLFGYPAAEAVGRSWEDFIAPTERQPLLDAVRSEPVLDGLPGRGMTLEIEFRKRSGLTGWAEASLGVVDVGGEPHALAIVRDTTERRRTEQLLRDSEARYRLLADAAFEGITVQENGRHLDVNEAFAAMMGYERTELIGGSALDLAAPESHEAILEHIRSGSEEPYEVTGIRKDGRRLHLEVRGRTLRLGRRALRVAALRDITQRDETERRLRFLADAGALLPASLDVPRTLQDIAGVAISTLADWCAIYVMADNHSVECVALAHADPALQALADAINRAPGHEVDAPEQVWAVMDEGRARLSTSPVDALPTISGHIPGPLREFGSTSSIMTPLVARGHTLGVLALFTAGTRAPFNQEDLMLSEEIARRAALAIDNARLYQEAQTAIRARDEFFSIASHELRTPVTAIKGTVQLLERARAGNFADAARLERLIPRLAAAVERLTVLVEDLLDVSRLRTGHLDLRPEALDLAEFVRHVVERYAAQLEEHHGLELTVQEDCPVMADPGRLEQVLENLLTNAAKYSPDGGTIGVTVEQVPGGVELAVTDSGIGLPEGVKDSIFEPFGRAPNAATHRIPGLGLGLYISRQIVERHQGRIWAESKGEGRGTTVRVWLPRVEPATQPARQPAPPRAER